MIDTAQTIRIDGEFFDKRNVNKLFYSNEPHDSWRNAIYNFLSSWYDETESIMVRTSGSTGEPKTIHLSKQSMINSARMTNEFFGLDKTKTALLCLPASYIAGKMMLVRAMVGEFNLICVEPKSNPFQNIETKVDIAAITPFQLSHSVETIKEKQIENIIVGGGNVNTQLASELQSIPTRFFETYGMTETCSHIALRQLNGFGKSDFFTTLSGISIRHDQRNCLVIETPHLFEGEIITNDIVELINASIFRWLGRFDSVINSGGIKIHPEQVEKKLENLIQSQFFISSTPNHLLGQKVVLLIESEDFDSKHEIKLLNEMKRALNKYEMPTLILYVEQFIYSKNKKLLRIETLNKALGSTVEHSDIGTKK